MEDAFIGFVGFGLIGGSIAKSLKLHFPNCHIIAYDYSGNNPNLHLAHQDQIVDRIVTEFNQGFELCDFIFLCAPVLKNICYLEQIKPLLKKDCIITDVGSVKQNIHEKVEELSLSAYFIGGHPMAGSEKTGYSNATTTLFENAYYILTPTSEVSKEKIDIMKNFVTLLGAIPVILPPSEHDVIVSAISHVPHIIAATLVNLVHQLDNEDELMQQLAAGGFKDITRIASSSPEMWQNICLTNTDSILHCLNEYQNVLDKMKELLQNHEELGLLKIFQEAKEYRDNIPRKSVGLIQKIHEIYVDIIDEAGAIATVATILSSNRISIKNIGIIHNREFEDGVLRIELYDEPSCTHTIDLLQQYHYTIYER